MKRPGDGADQQDGRRQDQAEGHQARRQPALPAQPGRHPGHRRPRVPGLGRGRTDRQHRLGVWVAALGVTVLLRPATRLAAAGLRS